MTEPQDKSKWIPLPHPDLARRPGYDYGARATKSEKPASASTSNAPTMSDRANSTVSKAVSKLASLLGISQE